MCCSVAKSCPVLYFLMNCSTPGFPVLHHLGKVMSLLFNMLSRGEGNGTPLQYSCLENPRDGGAWWAAVYGVTQSQTLTEMISSSSSSRFVIAFLLRSKHLLIS